MSPRGATIEDVASAAGVSAATVSRALRGLPNVAPSTRDRVRAVAEELQYRADPMASALAAGRTQTIAMVVPLLDSWYFSQVMAGAEAVLADAGYDLLLFAINADERRQRILGGPLIKRADGLILVDLWLPEGEAAALVQSGVALVSVGMEVEGASSVMVDDVTIGREAVEHLLGLGHRRIAVIQGITEDPLRFAVPEHRRLGYRAAMASAGIDVPAEFEIAGNFSLDGGTQAMSRLLDLTDPPTAIFAMSDEMAFGALRELWDRGLRVPEDVSIVGVDDHDFSKVIGLTTVQQQVAEHGTIAARMLLDHLAGRERKPRRHTAATAFIKRSTTGPAPS